MSKHVDEVFWVDHSDIETWYRHGVDDATAVPRVASRYQHGTTAEHWWSRGFQWMSANLDRQRLMRDLAAFRAALEQIEDGCMTLNDAFIRPVTLPALSHKEIRQIAAAALADHATQETEL